MAGWRLRAEPAVRFALCWLIPTWIVFELVPTKLPHYTLPAYGALAWLMAQALAEPIGPRMRRWGAGLSTLNGVLIAAIGFVAMWKLSDWTALPWAIGVAALYVAAGLAGSVLILRQNAGRALIVAGGVGVIAHGVMAAGLAPALSPLWLSDRAASVLTQGGANPRGGMIPGPVTVAGYAEPSIVFALGAATDLTDHGADAAAAIVDGRPAIVEQSQEAAFQAALKATNTEAGYIGRVEGLDYSKGRHDILRVYRPLPVGPDPNGPDPSGTPP
jgi:4-amino-4-deoxy-L-arabinose transferase-like glycosyltransferase